VICWNALVHAPSVPFAIVFTITIVQSVLLISRTFHRWEDATKW